MASYTDVDIAASGRFAEANNTIRIIQRLAQKAPHLASWLSFEIRDATHDDYYIPATLEHAAKIITVNITEELCERLSCNPMKERDNCKPNETASYYYVGDDSYDIQCQPACYHSATKISYNEDGSRAADVPQLNWNKNECKIVNSSVTSWLEKTFYRSATKYELRVNDMPTGFSRIESANPYGAGYTYKTNKAYCKYYDRTLQADGSCQMTLLEKLLDAVIGQTLINSIKSGVRMLTNNGVPFEIPTDLPELPTELNVKYTLDGWKNNIDPAFIIPNVIDTAPKLPTTRSATYFRSNVSDTVDAPTSIHDARRKAELESMDNISNFMRTSFGLDLDKSDEKIYGLDENGDILQPMGSSPSRAKRSVDSTDGLAAEEPETEEKKHWTETMSALFISLMRMFTHGDTYVYFGTDIVAQMALKKIKTLALKIVEKMSAFLAKGLLDITGSIGSKVLLVGIKSMTVKLVTGMALRVGAKIAVMLAKILGAAASVIGWILVGTMLLDMLFSFWDPFGYNNLFPPEIPGDLMDSGELALRQALSEPTANYKFENLAALILSEDELLEIQLESLIDRLIYLDSLVVNSEGSRIDKGREVNVNTGSTFELDAVKNQANTERVRFNVENFEIYNDRFMTRVEANKYLNYIALTSVIFGGIFIATKLPILCLVAMIIGAIALALARFELQDDILIDMMDKYRNKSPVYGENNYGYSQT